MHAPSIYRDLIRRLKAGKEDPRLLLSEGQRLEDPAWRSRTMRDLSADRRLQWQESKMGLREAVKAAQAVERLAQRGEVWAHLLQDLDIWRAGARNPEAPVERKLLLETCLKELEAMPDGEWTHNAVVALAPVVPAGHERLLKRALSNAGFEAAGAKAIVKAFPDAAYWLQEAPADVRAFAMESGALEAAWEIEDPTKRAEAIRLLVWKADEKDRLDVYAKSAQGKSADDQVRVWIQVGARLDKLGLDGAEALWAAAEAVLPRCENKRLADKLAQAREHGSEKPKPPTQRVAIVAEPSTGVAGNTLALVNTYQGGLKRPHLLAIARAAPLCFAFDLDLALIDFPGDVPTMVQAVETETGIGEGGRYLTALHEARRLHTQLHGTVVATTPKPHRAKAAQLNALPGPICLLMGVGPQGLPESMIDAARYHYEITGEGISLETATAMGILAERLRAYAATGAK